MTRRLIKIAKEFNVGTGTIVDYLKGQGYDIDNKPTSQVTDEMYESLLVEFKTSRVVKEQAAKITIGNRPSREDGDKGDPLSLLNLTPTKKEEPEPTPAPEVIAEQVEEATAQEADKATEEADTPTEQKTEAQPEEEKPKRAKVQIKVLGKIDLAPKKADQKPEEEAPESTAPEEEGTQTSDESSAPVEQDTVAPADDAPEKAEDGTPAPTSDETPEVVKADAPQLKGLKILGKIEIEKPKPKGKSTDEKRPKRKRTRKRVTAQDIAKGRGKGRRRQDEVKEVSQKEIDEQIKATMARMSGGGKNKRQKIRRDKRETIREKAELNEMRNVDEKLRVTEFISVSDLASLMNVSATEVIMTCMNLGVIVSINQRLDAEVIELVASEFEHEIEFITAEEQVSSDDEQEEEWDDHTPRAPIVTVMGHVDHGKTSLLDYIRSANVASGEAGGITQHIGAYEVTTEAGKRVTFLDTPGHEAFTAMRARGAKITDVAVIIIAADDRIMPQTKEAISHAQAAGVPIVFAINKVDKDGADPERIKQELASMNLLVESWGGKYQSQDISAKTGLGIDELLEKILLEAELLELKSSPERDAIGTVIEASLDKGRGYVTKLLVANGTLKIGDAVLAGEHSGKVKAMFNERGKKIKEAGPSSPVLLLGLSGAPQAGENFRVMDNEPEARALATKRAQILREQNTRAAKRMSLDEIGRRLALGTFKELNLIVKGDVDGSVEALSDSLEKLSQETVGVNVIHKAVGQIIESDVLLASASDAIIVGFQVRPSLGARQLAEKEGVEIKTYSIIYEAIEEIKMAIEGLLEPTKEEKVLGQVQVRETYKISKVGTVAGCYVQEGRITRNANVRIVRDGIVIYPTKEGVVGEISSLKRFKDDIKEVKNGMECGITIKNFNDIKVDDVIEAYEIIEIKQTLA